MPVPRYLNDGDFTTVQQNGPWEYRFPFYEKDDSITFEAKAKFRVQASSYKPLVVMSTKTFYQSSTQISDVTFSGASAVTCYLVDEGDADDVGQGLLEWTRVYSPVPQTRTEYASTQYAYQILRTIVSSDQPFSASVAEVQLTLACKIVYTYSTTVPATVVAPQVQVIASDGVNACRVYYFGGWGTITPGDWTLSKGTETQIYKGGIYVQIATYVQFPGSTSGSP